MVPPNLAASTEHSGKPSPAPMPWAAMPRDNSSRADPGVGPALARARDVLDKSLSGALPGEKDMDGSVSVLVMCAGAVGDTNRITMSELGAGSVAALAVRGHWGLAWPAMLTPTLASAVTPATGVCFTACRWALRARI